MLIDLLVQKIAMPRYIHVRRNIQMRSIFRAPMCERKRIGAFFVFEREGSVLRSSVINHR